MMIKKRSFAIGLWLCWGAFWAAACVWDGGIVWDISTEAGSRSPILPKTPSFVSPTPTAFPLPTQVFERGNREIVITAETADFERRNPDRERIAETSHFAFFAEDGYFPVPVDELQTLSEEVFTYVSERLGASVERKIALSFRRPDTGSCPIRGMAMIGSEPQIYIYADEGTSREQLLGVLAHEVGHIIHRYGFAEDLSGGRFFDEGLATWAAGEYWHAWQETSSWEASVKTYLETDAYLPLYQNYDRSRAYSEAVEADEACLDLRDTLYTEWAAFIDYLMEEYGRDKLFVLLRTSSIERTGAEIVVNPPDYEAVYGSALNQLETAWLSHIRTQPTR